MQGWMWIVAAVVVLVIYLAVRSRRRSSETPETVVSEEVKVTTPAVDVKPAEDEMDEELVAVISAAVAAFLGRPASNLKVRSIRRLEPNAPTWGIMGRQDQINSRF